MLQSQNQPPPSSPANFSSTFYFPAQNSQALQQTHQIISSSKKLIQQNEERRRNLARSSKNLAAGELSGGSWGSRKLTTRQKIEDSFRNGANGGTVVEEVLGNGVADQGKKDQYLTIVENIFGHKKVKKNRRKSRKRESSSESDKKYARESKSFLTSVLQQQVIRNVNSGSNNFLKEDYQNQERNQKNMESSKNIKKYLQEEMEQFDNQLKSKTRIKGQGQESGEGRKEMKKHGLDQTNRVSIKLGSKNSINAKEDSLIQLSLSESDDEGQTQVKTSNEADLFLSKLMKQIDDDINGFKKGQTHTHEHTDTANTNSYDYNVKKSLRTKNLNYNSGSSSSSLDLKQNQKGKAWSPSKSGNGIYSFRENGTSEGFLMPKEDKNLTNLAGQEEDSSEREGRSKLPYHPDHGTGLPQPQIQKLLSVIQNRIKFSPAIIDPIHYEHSREDNNQLQIDSRFKKQSKDRAELIGKIINYQKEKNRFTFNRCKVNRFYQGFRIDQAGKRAFIYGGCWKSPVKGVEGKFVSLKSPISNGESCCNDKKLRYLDTNWRTLLLSRSADTLATASEIFVVRKQQQREEPSSQSELEIEPKYKLALGDQNCIIKEPRWQVIKKLRKEIET